MASFPHANKKGGPRAALESRKLNLLKWQLGFATTADGAHAEHAEADKRKAKRIEDTHRIDSELRTPTELTAKRALD